MPGGTNEPTAQVTPQLPASENLGRTGRENVVNPSRSAGADSHSDRKGRAAFRGTATADECSATETRGSSVSDDDTANKQAAPKIAKAVYKVRTFACTHVRMHAHAQVTAQALRGYGSGATGRIVPSALRRPIEPAQPSNNGLAARSAVRQRPLYGRDSHDRARLSRRAAALHERAESERAARTQGMTTEADTRGRSSEGRPLTNGQALPRTPSPSTLYIGTSQPAMSRMSCVASEESFKSAVETAAFSEDETENLKPPSQQRTDSSFRPYSVTFEQTLQRLATPKGRPTKR